MTEFLYGKLVFSSPTILKVPRKGGYPFPESEVCFVNGEDWSKRNLVLGEYLYEVILSEGALTTLKEGKNKKKIVQIREEDLQTADNFSIQDLQKQYAGVVFVVNNKFISGCVWSHVRGNVTLEYLGKAAKRNKKFTLGEGYEYEFDFSNRKGKKYKVTIKNLGVTVHFGNSNYQHFRTAPEIYKDKPELYVPEWEHGDERRRELYLERASKIKDKEGRFTFGDITSPNYWSYWYLWQ